MSLFCQSTNPNCDGDQAVAMLSSIFGSDFINAFINLTGPAATASSTGTLTNIVVGGVGSVAFSLIFFAAVAVGFNALLKSAQDGEVFGEGSKKQTIVARVLYSIIMLLPTVSGYHLIQVIGMGVVLWSNNVSNTINNLTTAEALVSSASLADTKDKERDIFKFRTVTPNIIRQLHCTHVLNKEFYNLDPQPGRWYWDATTAPINANPGISRVMVDYSVTYLDKTKKNDNNWTGKNFTYVIGDRRLEVGGMEEPICGAASVSIINPASVNSELMQIPVYRLRQSDQNKINQSLALIQSQLQNAKMSLYTKFFVDLENWYIAYGVNPNATANEGVFPFSKEALKALDVIVNKYINDSHIAVSQIMSSGSGHAAVNDVVTTLNNKGWMYTPEARIKVSQYQAIVEKYITEPLWSFTPPALNSGIISNSKGEAINNSVNVALDNAVDLLTSQDQWVQNADPSNLANLLTLSADGGGSNKSENIEQKLSANSSAFLTNISKAISMKVMLGNSGDAQLLNGQEPSDADPATLYRNTNVIRNIQDTGEFILATKTLMQGAVLALKFKVATIKGASTATSSVPLLGEKTHKASNTLHYIVEDIIAPALASLIRALTVIGVWMAVIIPYMPMALFSLACVGWLIHIFYALCGLPLWALMHMIPERSFVGSQTQGYVTVLTLFMRPIFIVVGYWLAEITVGVVLVFITDSFFSYQGTMSIAYSSGNITRIINELTTFIYKFGFYLFVVTSALYLIYGLVFSIADQVQQWIGSGLNGGNWGETNSKEAIQKAGMSASTGGLGSVGGLSAKRELPISNDPNNPNNPNNPSGSVNPVNPSSPSGGGGGIMNAPRSTLNTGAVNTTYSAPVGGGVSPSGSPTQPQTFTQKTAPTTPFGTARTNTSASIHGAGTKINYSTATASSSGNQGYRTHLGSVTVHSGQPSTSSSKPFGSNRTFKGSRKMNRSRRGLSSSGRFKKF